MQITRRALWKECKLFFMAIIIGLIAAFLVFGCFKYNEDEFGFIDERNIIGLTIAPYLFIFIYRILKQIYKILREQ